MRAGKLHGVNEMTLLEQYDKSKEALAEVFYESSRGGVRYPSCVPAADRCFYQFMELEDLAHLRLFPCTRGTYVGRAWRDAMLAGCCK